MDKSRKGLLLPTVLLTTLALASCGGGDDGEESTNASSSPEPSSPTEQPTPTSDNTLIVDINNVEGVYRSISDAVKDVPPGGSIWVYPGTYRETLVLGDKDFRLSAVGLSVDTVIMPPNGCQGNCTPLSIVGSSSELQVSGFTLTGGKGQSCEVSELSTTCGGGLFIENSNARLSNMLVVGNESAHGGGIYLSLEAEQSPTLSNLSVLGNRAEAGGGLFIRGGRPELSLLQIADNVASLQGGAADLRNTSLSLSNVVVSYNSAVVGGGFSVANSELKLDYASLSGNFAAINGGAIELMDGSNLEVVGGIFYQNTADSQGNELDFSCSSCSAVVSYSNVFESESAYGGAFEQALRTGIGMMDSDPLFVAGTSFRLQSESPCIDAGFPGDSDPDGSNADLGAYGSDAAGLWDLDGDGVYAAWFAEGNNIEGVWDCDDHDPSVFPGSEEVCDGKDSDCNGEMSTLESDVDGDGYFLGCGEALDCDDTNELVYPGGPEGEGGDGLDNDCDAIADEGTSGGDDDGDGFCLGYESTNGELVCANSDHEPGDCDDLNPDQYPGALEACDGLDTNCVGGPGVDEVDNDSDGFMVCEGDVGEADGYNTIFPGASEDPNDVPDNVDNDLDGVVDEGTAGYDDDGDGYCEWPDVCTNGGKLPDCDDTNALVGPGLEEICDGVDTDCSGEIPEGEADADGDGYRLCDGDCDDSQKSVFPGAEEIAGNEVDEDCDGWDLGAVGFGAGNPEQSLSLSCSQGSNAPRVSWSFLYLLLGGALLRRFTWSS